MEVDFASVTDNYAALPEEEKTIVRERLSEPMGVITSKLFGAEFAEAVGTFNAPTAAPQPRAVAPTPTPTKPTPVPQGLGMRPQR
tara:strand:+ start:356 stop:610 length:255 start_codon:yes stop_codon:yes gene_type:complete